MTYDQNPPGQDTSESRWSLGTMLPAVWSQRVRLVLVASVVACLTLAVNFLLPTYFKASAKLLPDLERSRLTALQQLPEVAQLVGVAASGQDPGRLYPAILTSETILRAAVLTRYRISAESDSADLIGYFDIDAESPEEGIEEAIVRLRDLMAVQFENRTGVVTATLEMRDPRVAADVLNAIVNGLDGFMRQKRSSHATEQRNWIDTRLRGVQKELREAEEDLKAFREKNRRIFDSPQLLLEQERYLREVQVKSTIFIELVKQLELAKIEEIRNVAIVNVLDPARPPVRKERPRRGANTLLAFLGTLMLGGFAVGVREVYRPSAVLGHGLR